MSKIRSRIADWRWRFIGLMTGLLFFFEAFDYASQTPRMIQMVEFLIYLLLLLIIGLLYSSSQTISFWTRMNKIIDYKHKLSQEFSIHYEWEGLANQIARFPTTIAEVEYSVLYVCNPISSEFELIAQWPPATQKTGERAVFANPNTLLKENPDIFLKFSRLGSKGIVLKQIHDRESFYLPARYGQSLLGLIGFKLMPGYSLSNDQHDVFSNIGDEIGFAIKTGQDRKAQIEMSRSEITLAERRRVSHYLHDHLGQNLAYLHLKLDQMATNKNQATLEQVMAEIEHLRKIANDSYEIIRGILEIIQPETSPVLVNLLMEHAKKVSKRANLEIKFQTVGTQIPLEVDVKRVIFYAFQEALSNAEKHARASEINVIAEWLEDNVALTITDNGTGFKPEEVNTNKHFGLGILRERLEQIGGDVSLISAEKNGTTVFLRVPISVQNRLRVNT